MGKVVPVLCLLLGLSAVLEATHFRGGQITWRPVLNDPLTVTLNLRLSWRRNSMTPECDESQILSQTITGFDEKVECTRGCSGDVANTLLYCTDFSASENWMVGAKEVNYTFPGPPGSYQIEYVGSAWIAELAIGGFSDWVLQSTIDLARRPDTGRANNPPSMSTLPIVRVNTRCDTQETIRIPVADADGDTVRCRWAAGASECRQVCNGFPMAMLDQDKCELTFRARQLTSEWYAVALMIEDFRPGLSTPLSTSPVQFLVNGYVGAACTRPSFAPSTPPDGTIFHYDSNCRQPFQLTVTAAPADPNDSIQEISLVARLGITKGPVTPLNNAAKQSYSTISWTPPKADATETVVVAAKDQNGLTTAQRSFIIKVYRNSGSLPNLCKGQSYCQYCGLFTVTPAAITTPNTRATPSTTTSSTAIPSATTSATASTRSPTPAPPTRPPVLPSRTTKSPSNIITGRPSFQNPGIPTRETSIVQCLANCRVGCP